MTNSNTDPAPYEGERTRTITVTIDCDGPALDCIIEALKNILPFMGDNVDIDLEGE